MQRRFTTILPLPPAANNLFINIGRGGRAKSKRYREWEKAVDALKPAGIVELQGEVIAVYTCGRPDRRRRDVANLEKAPSDTMTRWGVLEDDSQIVDIRLRWGESDVVAPGFVLVILAEETTATL